MDKKAQIKRFPRLSIITPTYNAAKILERYFSGLTSQTIWTKDIEVLIVDGGSNDTTKQIAKKYGARIIHNRLKLAEPGVALGFKKARGRLIMVLATDNIYKDSHALERMIKVFSNKKVTAAFPKHDTGPGDTIFSKYFNTFTDPYTHFVYGQASNARTFKNIYRSIRKTKLYDIYDFRSNNTYPLLALAQGFTIRREEIERTKEKSDDVLVVYNLINKGKLIAYVHGVTLFHYTIAGLQDFLKKQRRAVENALVRADSGISVRNNYLTQGQKIKTYLFFPYALTIVVPLLQSLLHFGRTKKNIWLFHSVISFLSGIMIIFTATPLALRRMVKNKYYE